MFSFSKRKKVVDLCPRIRRLCDLTSPNLSTTLSGRSENRYNRAIPTLLGPWQEDHPVVDESTIGLTSDIADRGVCLVLNQPFLAESVVVGYWVSLEAMSEPWYFLGNICRNQPVGGGFWAVGIELAEFANANHVEELAALTPLAAKLLAPADSKQGVRTILSPSESF